MYLVFVVRPVTKSIPRAILKPPKVYFYDVADVIGDEGAYFENLVAIELMKRLQFIEDAKGFRSHLGYIRDKEGREVDFAVVREGNLEDLIEVKWSDTTPAKALLYYAERLKPKRAVQVVGGAIAPYRKSKFYLTSAIDEFGAPLGSE
jgi:predicted AAA+ superfamily ATPase